MALSVVQAAGQQPAGGATVAVTLTSSPTAGNILVGFVGCDSGLTVSAPSGSWTQIFAASVPAQSSQLAAFWYVVQPGDGKTWTFGLSGSDNCAGSVVEVTGASTSTPVNRQNSGGIGATASVVTPSVTPSVLGCLALASWCGNEDHTVSSISSGWSTQFNGASGTAFHSNYTTSKNALTTDTSTAISCTINLSSNDFGVAGTVLIAPAPATGTGALLPVTTV